MILRVIWDVEGEMKVEDCDIWKTIRTFAIEFLNFSIIFKKTMQRIDNHKNHVKQI